MKRYTIWTNAKRGKASAETVVGSPFSWYHKAMITEEIKRITEKIKEALDPERIYLFGSYARNEETEKSDYDFYVVVDEEKGNPLLLCDKAYSAIFDIQEKPCDVIVNHKSKFDIRKYRPTLEKTVANEGVLLYEK
ncbi:nucleotidyltransferase family protein [Treponema sp. Marseille-Q4132]|uniref:nucleotidyltransferase family protein n=1 Tax=Treponema sp. Marseille-Q4132 TaxID=2766701 RepID=UPI0020917C12|nr:nucleotidyltransferase domain-containing protein [Treponema sp. Marseille-Q4132]